MQQATATATKLCVNTRGHILTATLISKFSTLQIKTNKKMELYAKIEMKVFHCSLEFLVLKNFLPPLHFFYQICIQTIQNNGNYE
jgi:hypothetical protein